MKKRYIGICFCAISLLLFAIRCLCAYIAISNTGLLDINLFNAIIKYSGTPIFILSVVFLMIGVTYLLLEELRTSSNN